jgi:arylformamidase
MRRTFDISLPISNALVTWPGDPQLALERVATLDSDGVNLTRLACSAHTGTHVDAPDHFIAGGATVEALPLDALIGPAHVVALPSVHAITHEHLQALDLPADATRILFKTDNSRLWAGPDAGTFQRDFVAVTPDAAQALVDQGVRLVGVDYLSVEPFAGRKINDHPTHRILLGAGVVIVEGLNMTDVPPGVYELICLPLKLVGADGAPARAVLREMGD